jgi:hypothetical protein
VRILNRTRYDLDHSVLLAGPKRVLVLEHPLGQSARLRKATTPTRLEMAWDRPEQIASVGCFALPSTPANCQDLRDRYRWQRLRTLARFEPEGPHAKVSDLAHIMLDTRNPRYSLFGRSTVQSMVFDPQQRVLQLYAAPSDGQHPDDPFMQRYSGLAVRAKRTADGVVSATGGAADEVVADVLLIWLMVAILGVILVYARWRSW